MAVYVIKVAPSTNRWVSINRCLISCVGDINTMSRGAAYVILIFNRCGVPAGA